MSFNYPAAMRFRCIKCGICCGDTQEKVRHILLMKKEAEQIAAATLQPISAFAVKVQDKAPYSFELRKTTKEGECVFLKNNRCAIYSLRPLICRFYPLQLKTGVNRKHEFLHTSECPGIGKGKLLRANDFERLFQLAQAKARAERRLNEEKG